MAHIFSKVVGGKELKIEVGKFAEQASAAALVTYGESVVLATVCTAGAREGMDFFPLTVDYEERLYANGKIPGSFFRREARPPTSAILTSRVTDRSIRPLFPKGFRNEVQVIISAVSHDQENPLDILAIIGASIVLSLSELPFSGPVAGCRIGYVDSEFIVNPTYDQNNEGSLDLTISSTNEAVVMVEAGASELPEDIILDALEKGREVNSEIIEFIEEIKNTCGKEKIEFIPSAEIEGLQEDIKNMVGDQVKSIFDEGSAKGERNEVLDDLQDELNEKLAEKYESGDIKEGFEKILKKTMRNKILVDGKRPDGRGLDEIRPLSIEVGILPRTHGTGLFQRGQTQVLSVATLAGLSMAQNLDNLSPEETKRYMHHYNFMPYSTGEVRRLMTGRREIGHGALAERALEPVIPSEEEFPYAIRIVSEILSSNGSTSMGSVCGSTLSLMDAGVPIKSPVAGIAMGLILSDDSSNYAVLTDIQGIEDFQGDMDFKVAGSRDGITALQMDVKVQGINFEIMKDALGKAKDARNHILDAMLEVIDSPRVDMNPYAPRMIKIKVPSEKIGTVIGPGGKTIRGMIQEYNVSIDVSDDGTVVVGSSDQSGADAAIFAIQSLVKEIEVGEIYTGTVKRIMNFGAFVEVLPGKEGLVHISQLATHRVENVTDEVEVGDEITVVVKEIDQQGRVNLSRKAVLSDDTDDDSSSSEDNDRNSKGRSNNNRRDRPDNRNRF